MRSSAPDGIIPKRSTVTGGVLSRSNRVMNKTNSESAGLRDPKAKIWWIAYPKFSQDGPFTIDELKEKAQAKILESNTLVWCHGWKDWKRAGECGELASFVRSSS